MSFYYNADGQPVQSVQVLPPYPLEPQPQSPVMNADYPNQQVMPPTYPAQTQTRAEPYNSHSPDQYGARRSPRLHNRIEATPPYTKRKSTTRKVAEGVLIGVAGTVVLSEI